MDSPLHRVRAREAGRRYLCQSLSICVNDPGVGFLIAPEEIADLVSFEWFEVLPDNTRIDAAQGEMPVVQFGDELHRLVLRVKDTTGQTDGDDVEVTVMPPDCNSNGRDDALDISDGFSQDLNGNQAPDECEIGTVHWTFQGTAQGGDITVMIEGFLAACTINLMTTAGESAAVVAANIAAALNANACLAGQNIQSSVSGGRVMIRGFELSYTDLTVAITDLGLTHETFDIPSLSPSGLVVLWALLITGGILIIRRRSSRR